MLRGHSYGARLAKEIYRQDPAGIAGLLLDSPAPTAPFFGPADTITRANDAIDRLAAACAAQPTCAATGPFEENMAAAAARLDQQPYSGAVGPYRRRRQLLGGDPGHAPLRPAPRAPRRGRRHRCR